MNDTEVGQDKLRQPGEGITECEKQRLYFENYTRKSTSKALYIKLLQLS